MKNKWIQRCIINRKLAHSDLVEYFLAVKAIHFPKPAVYSHITGYQYLQLKKPNLQAGYSKRSQVPKAKTPNHPYFADIAKNDKTDDVCFSGSIPTPKTISRPCLWQPIEPNRAFNSLLNLATATLVYDF